MMRRVASSSRQDKPDELTSHVTQRGKPQSIIPLLIAAVAQAPSPLRFSCFDGMEKVVALLTLAYRYNQQSHAKASDQSILRVTHHGSVSTGEGVCATHAIMGTLRRP